MDRSFNLCYASHPPPIQGVFGAAATDEDARSKALNVQRLREAWQHRTVLDVSGGAVRLVENGECPPPAPTLLVDPHASAFLSTNLDYVLRRKGRARRFVVAGRGAEGIVESTVRDGADKGSVPSHGGVR